MKRTISRNLAWLLSLFMRPAEADVRILCYHGVNNNPDYLNVSPELFRDQMGMLARNGYASTSLTGFMADKSGGANGGMIIITFDDGYRDNYETAFPVMDEFGLSGTIFCTTGSIGMDRFLTAGQIREMAAKGWEFGSHTVTHPHLHLLATADKKRELRDSKNTLEDILGSGVDTFCYPYGEYDAECVELLAELGYKCACSNRPGANRLAGIDNPYLLRRTEIGGFDTPEDFGLKMAGGFDLLHRALHTVRGRP